MADVELKCQRNTSLLKIIKMEISQTLDDGNLMYSGQNVTP